MNTNTKAPEAGSGSATKALEPQPIRLTYSVEEAADLLGIGRSLAYELAQEGTLPGVRRFGTPVRCLSGCPRRLAREPAT